MEFEYDREAVGVTSWIEVSEERLAENFRTVAAAAGAETDVLAVVKANAYGHGAEVSAVALARAGATWFGRGGHARGRAGAEGACGGGVSRCGDPGDVRVDAGGRGGTCGTWADAGGVDRGADGLVAPAGGVCECMWRWIRGWGGRGVDRGRSWMRCWKGWARQV